MRLTSDKTKSNQSLRELFFLQRERTGNVGLAIWALNTHDEIQGLVFKSTTAAAGRTMNYLLVEGPSPAVLSEFEHYYMRAIDTLDTTGDFANESARRLPLPSQQVDMRLQFANDAGARNKLLSITAKQAARFACRMREFEANVERWSDEGESGPVVVSMRMVVENKEDKIQLARFACDLARWSEKTNTLFSMHRPGGPIFARVHDPCDETQDVPFEFRAVCEWLGVDPADDAEDDSPNPGLSPYDASGLQLNHGNRMDDLSGSAEG